LGTTTGRHLEEPWASTSVSALSCHCDRVRGAWAMAYWSSRPDYALLYASSKRRSGPRSSPPSMNPRFLTKSAGGIQSSSLPTRSIKSHAMAGKGIPRGDRCWFFEIFDKANFGISDFVPARTTTPRAVQGNWPAPSASLTRWNPLA